MTDEHTNCINQLIEIGKRLDFDASRAVHGKMYELANPDCIWYYKGKGEKELRKIARGDRALRLPFIAFEVACSEKEKALRGSLVSLQLANASASIIVLGGSSVALKSKLRKMVGRYSASRFRIWTVKDVNELHTKVLAKYPESVK